MPIPDRLIDKTTIVKNHTVWTHMVCIIIRVTLGLLVLKNKIQLKNAQYIGLCVLCIFMYKYINVSPIWKVYIRTLIVYTLVSSSIKLELSKETIGILIIVDALLAVQSRHITSNFLS
jgi:hypothetical protein